MVRGYHVCKDIWDAAVGQEFPCKRKDGNRVDPFAVAVVRGDTVIGHLKKILSTCSLYIPTPRWLHCLSRDGFQTILRGFSSRGTGNTVCSNISRRCLESQEPSQISFSNHNCFVGK